MDLLLIIVIVCIVGWVISELPVIRSAGKPQVVVEGMENAPDSMIQPSMASLGGPVDTPAPDMQPLFRPQPNASLVDPSSQLQDVMGQRTFISNTQSGVLPFAQIQTVPILEGSMRIYPGIKTTKTETEYTRGNNPVVRNPEGKNTTASMRLADRPEVTGTYGMYGGVAVSNDLFYDQTGTMGGHQQLRETVSSFAVPQGRTSQAPVGQVVTHRRDKWVDLDGSRTGAPQQFNAPDQRTNGDFSTRGHQADPFASGPIIRDLPKPLVREEYANANGGEVRLAQGTTRTSDPNVVLQPQFKTDQTPQGIGLFEQRKEKLDANRVGAAQGVVITDGRDGSSTQLASKVDVGSYNQGVGFQLPGAVGFGGGDITMSAARAESDRQALPKTDTTQNVRAEQGELRLDTRVDAPTSGAHVKDTSALLRTYPAISTIAN